MGRDFPEKQGFFCKEEDEDKELSDSQHSVFSRRMPYWVHFWFPLEMKQEIDKQDSSDLFVPGDSAV